MPLNAFDKYIFMHKTKQLYINSCVANSSSKETGGITNCLGNDMPVQETETT